MEYLLNSRYKELSMILTLYHQPWIKLKREYEVAKAGDKRSTLYQLLRLIRLFLHFGCSSSSGNFVVEGTGAGVNSLGVSAGGGGSYVGLEDLKSIWVAEGFST